MMTIKMRRGPPEQNSRTHAAGPPVGGPQRRAARSAAGELLCPCPMTLCSTKWDDDIHMFDVLGTPG